MTANQPDLERSIERLTQKPTGVSRERFRIDKRAYMEDLAKEAEEAALKGRAEKCL